MLAVVIRLACDFDFLFFGDCFESLLGELVTRFGPKRFGGDVTLDQMTRGVAYSEAADLRCLSFFVKDFP